ncbi:hypothetical protein O9993_07400 [Vibrio lentus]|nr:hypothetical protein [Vibrio lentus]
MNELKYRSVIFLIIGTPTRCPIQKKLGTGASKFEVFCLKTHEIQTLKVVFPAIFGTVLACDLDVNRSDATWCRCCYLSPMNIKTTHRHVDPVLL